LRIKDQEIYKNKEGKTETKRQAWYYQQYSEMPPQIRTIPNLYRFLEKKSKTEALPYKLVKMKTIYDYYHKFDWEDRILSQIGYKRKREHMQNSDYLMGELWKDTMKLHNESRKNLKKINWDEVEDLEEDTQKINNLVNIQRTYNQTLQLLTGQPVSLATLYAMIEVLQATESDEQDRTELIQSLLHKGDDKV
jgi:hypothetical protein